MTADMNSLLNAEILICIGSGGVGKTTIAATLGVMAAQQGKRVLVLTIDPSKRLASTLGIEGRTDVVLVPGQNFKGQLYASVIDHKQTFDEFVYRAAENAGSISLADKILKNKLYQQLSTNLSGSQDFTSLEKLYSSVQSKKYDLVILDTPPTQHAIDFLKAPQKLSALFNEKITKWFIDPSGQKKSIFINLLHLGTKQVLKILESLTGSEFITQLIDFFANIEKWQGHLYQRTIEFHRMLTAPTTRFCLVTSFDMAKVKEAEYFVKELKKGGFDLNTIIFNRSFPDWLSQADTDFQNEPMKNLYIQIKDYYLQKNDVFEQFQKQFLAHIHFYKIPDMVQDIADLNGLENVSKFIKKAEGSIL
ncbi:MAG: ArsA family ATPase [Pseudobdellovibrionaceae bacterium]